MKQSKIRSTDQANGDGSGTTAPGMASRNRRLTAGPPPHPNPPVEVLPRRQWRQIAPHLPDEMEGWHALEIGCGTGSHAFELARRGAHVTVIGQDPGSLRQGRWAAQESGLAEWITFRQMDVHDLARSDRSYDLVLFMGSLFLQPDPLLALDIVAARVRRVLILQTAAVPGEEVLEDTFDRGLHDREALCNPGWPAMAFLESQDAEQEPHRWLPSHAGMQAMLRSCGLRITERPGPEFYLCEPDPENPSSVTTWNSGELEAALRALQAPGERPQEGNGRSHSRNGRRPRGTSSNHNGNADAAGTGE